MQKKTAWILIMLAGLYALGLVAGGVFQVNVKEQSQMYEYLKNGVSAYGEGFLDGTRAVFRDNIGELVILFISAYLPFGCYVAGGVLAVRGFMTGFAVTTMLRGYGLSGVLLCAGNIFSATITAVLYILYGLFTDANNLKVGRVRLGIFSIIYLLAVAGVDSVLKGGLSSVIMRMWK